MTARAALAASALAVALAAAGCGSDEPAAAPSPSASASAAVDTPSPTPAASATTPGTSSYLPVPAGVTLSDQGSALAVGATATVAWQPRQDTIGVLDVTIDRLEQTTVKRSFAGWKVPEQQATSTPYFVRATVVNRGETDLSGSAVPLYAVDGAQTLLEATSFASAFKPCRDGAFPDAFAPGATAQVCLVYFVPQGDAMTAVSFRPTQEFAPITWTGPVEKVAKTAKQQ